TNGTDRVALSVHQRAAEGLAGAQRGLEVYLGARAKSSERRASEGFRYGVERDDATAVDRDGSQADAVDGDGVADRKASSRLGRLDAQAHALCVAVDGDDATALANDAREHRPSLASPVRSGHVPGPGPGTWLEEA